MVLTLPTDSTQVEDRNAQSQHPREGGYDGPITRSRSEALKLPPLVPLSVQQDFHLVKRSHQLAALREFRNIYFSEDDRFGRGF